MYPVSNEYKNSINKKTRITKMTGRITLKDTTTIDITDDLIAEGGFELTNQCVSGSDFKLGSVFAAQLTMSLKTTVDRNKFFDAIVSPVFNLQLEDGTYEAVPLGVFKVSEANRVGKTVKLTAYDKMIDLSVKIKKLLSGQTITQMLQYIETKTGIPVSQATYDNMINLSPVDSSGNLIAFTSNKYNGNTTYRDVLSYCAELCGGLSYINRHGEIEIRRYSKTPDKTINDSIRNSSEFSDFEIQYGNITANIYSKNKKGEEILETEDYGFMDGAMTYTLSDNPYISRQTNEDKRRLIYENIERALENIIYTPSEISYIGDPALDLGDCIENTGYNTGGVSIYSLVMIYDFSYRRSCKLKCVGQNQSLAKADSLPGANLANSGEPQSLLSFLTYTNPAEGNIGNTKVSLCTFDLYVTDNNLIQVNGGLTVLVQSPGTFELVYSLNETYFQFYPRQVLTAGFHYIPIFYMIGVEEALDPSILNQFKIYILSQDGGSAKVPPYQFMVSLLSQSMSNVMKEWGGKLTFKEIFSPDFSIGPVFMDGILTDSVTAVAAQGGQSITEMGLTYSFVTTSGTYYTPAQVTPEIAPTIKGVAITGRTFLVGSVDDLKIPNTYSTSSSERAVGLDTSYNIVELGDGCLANSGITKITIPKFTTDIKTGALQYCQLSEITVPIQAHWWGGNVSYSSGVVKKITITPGVNGHGVDQEAGGWNFYTCTPWYICNDYEFTLTIEEGVKSTGKYGLYRARVQHLILPSTMEKIEDYGLYNSHIVDVNLPAAMNYLGFWSMSNCAQLRNVNYAGSQTQWQSITGYSVSGNWGYFLESSNAVINYQ